MKTLIQISYWELSSSLSLRVPVKRDKSSLPFELCVWLKTLLLNLPTDRARPLTILLHGII